MFFDTHAHLLSREFDNDRSRIIEELPMHNIAGYVECGTSQEDSVRAAALARDYAEVFAAVGVHPHEAAGWDRITQKVISSLLKEKGVVALGEIGLDYHYSFSPREKQKEVFRVQLEMAREKQAPVIIHTREAWQDTMEILSEFPEVTGVMHCFSGSVEIMHILLERGWYIAFGGAVTFKNAKKPLAALREVPLDRLLLETDSPYMTPVPYRGSRNDPTYVKLVAEKAAEIREEDLSVIEKATTENAGRVFGIDMIS